MIVVMVEPPNTTHRNSKAIPNSPKANASGAADGARGGEFGTDGARGGEFGTGGTPAAGEGTGQDDRP